jgi:hypothetical protein
LKIKDAIYRISCFDPEQVSYLQPILESIINISSSNGVVFSVILMAKVQVIAVYDAVIIILKLRVTHKEFRKIGCGYMLVS